MSVICMRDFSSLRCTLTAKIETSLLSMSSAISRGKSVSGRGARSSSTKALKGAPSFVSSAAMLAAISRFPLSVISVTFSLG